MVDQGSSPGLFDGKAQALSTPPPPSRAEPSLNLGLEVMMKQKGSVGFKSATECTLGLGNCMSQVGSGGGDHRPSNPSLSKAHTVNLRLREDVYQLLHSFSEH